MRIERLHERGWPTPLAWLVLQSLLLVLGLMSVAWNLIALLLYPLLPRETDTKVIYVDNGLGAKAEGPRSRLGAYAMEHLDIPHSGAATLVGVTFDAVDRLRIEGAAILGPSYGAYAGATLSLLTGKVRPIISAGFPVFVSDGARYGLRGAAGIEFQLNRHFALIAELGQEALLAAVRVVEHVSGTQEDQVEGQHRGGGADRQGEAVRCDVVTEDQGDQGGDQKGDCRHRWCQPADGAPTQLSAGEHLDSEAGRSAAVAADAPSNVAATAATAARPRRVRERLTGSLLPAKVSRSSHGAARRGCSQGKPELPQAASLTYKPCAAFSPISRSLASSTTARCPAAWWTARISIFEPGT